MGKKCLCNALMANIGHPQVRNGKYTEQALITSGNDLTGIDRFLREGSTTYTAGDVIQRLLRPTPHVNPSLEPAVSSATDYQGNHSPHPVTKVVAD